MARPRPRFPWILFEALGGSGGSTPPVVNGTATPGAIAVSVSLPAATATAGPPGVPYTNNLFAEWNASRTDTISHTGGLVDGWTDTVGGRVAAGVTTSRPVTNATTQNGNNVLDFDGADWLTVPTPADFAFLHNGQIYTIYVVAKIGTVSSPARDDGLVGTNAGASANIGASLYGNGNGAPNNRLIHLTTRGVGGSFVTNNVTADGAYPGNTWALYKVVGDPANATAANRSKIYVANGAAIQNNASSAADTNSDPSFSFQIGAVGNNILALFGSIAHVLIYTEEVTGANDTAVRGYIDTLWDVTV